VNTTTLRSVAVTTGTLRLGFQRRARQPLFSFPTATNRLHSSVHICARYFFFFSLFLDAVMSFLFYLNIFFYGGA